MRTGIALASFLTLSLGVAGPRSARAAVLRVGRIQLTRAFAAPVVAARLVPAAPGALGLGPPAAGLALVASAPRAALRPTPSVTPADLANRVDALASAAATDASRRPRAGIAAQFHAFLRLVGVGAQASPIEPPQAPAEERARRLKGRYEEALSRLKWAKPRRWWCQGPLCDEYAGNLYHALKTKEGLAPTLVTARRQLRHAQSRYVLNHHTYLVDAALEGEHELIVDPTYSQFLAEDRRADDPEILVGTRAELREFFVRNAGRLVPYRFLRDVNDPRSAATSREAPGAFFDAVYGIGGARVVVGEAPSRAARR